MIFCLFKGDDGSDGVQGLKGEEGEMGETVSFFFVCLDPY